MKNKLIRLFGVLATVATVMSLFVTAAPVSAGTQSWTSMAPNVSPYTLWIGPIEKTMDGSALYCAAAIDDSLQKDTDSHDVTTPDGDEGVFIYKSTDMGRTWAKTVGQPAESDDGLNAGLPAEGFDDLGKVTQVNVITDIVCSSVNASILYVTDGYDIFKSVDGGAVWVTLTNLFVKVGDAEGVIVSIDVGYFAQTAFVFAATTTWGDGLGGAYVLQESVFLDPWADLRIGDDRQNDTELSDDIDVTCIKVSPDYSVTQCIMAVVTDYEYDYDFYDLVGFEGEESIDAVTLLTTKYGPAEWAATASDSMLVFAEDQVQYPFDEALFSSSIWLPSDFSSDFTKGNMVAFVGIDPMDDTFSGDVFMCLFGRSNPTGMTVPAIDLNVNGIDSGAAISDLDGQGNLSTCALLASGYPGEGEGEDAQITAPFVPNGSDDENPTTWSSQNAGFNWAASLKRPTGGVSPLTEGLGIEGHGVALSSCRVAKDYAVSGVAIVGTHGIDCGVSYTNTFGASWNTVSMIATMIDNTVDMSLASDNTIYMTTNFVDDEGTLSVQVTAQVDDAGTPIDEDAVTLTKTNNTGWVFANFTVMTPGTEIELGPGDPDSSIIWTVGDGSAVGDTAVISLDSSGDTAVFSAETGGAVFTLDTDVGGSWFGGSGTYTLAWSTDEDQSAGHKVSIGGPIDDLYTVLLPDAESETAVTYFNASLTLEVLAGTVKVTGAATGNGTFTSGFHAITLNTAHPVATITGLEEFNQIEIDDDSGSPTISDFDFDTFINLQVEVEAYSAWRYNSTGWERINSWSLYYSSQDVPWVDWDFIRTTAANDALFMIDADSRTIYRSINRGNTWMKTSTTFYPALAADESIQSALALGPNSLVLGGEEGEIYYGGNLSLLSGVQAFSNDNVSVTDLRVAGNGDILAAGVGLPQSGTPPLKPTVYVAKAAGITGTWTSWSTSLKDSAATTAFIYPASDYNASGIVYITSDIVGSVTSTVAGIYYGTLGGSLSRADADAEWYPNGTNTTSYTGLVTGPGAVGFSQEGVGMAYATNKDGVARIKGRVASSTISAAELIKKPSAAIHGLWIGGAASPGNVLYALGDDGAVWTYTDMLNVAVIGLSATAPVNVAIPCEDCPGYSGQTTLSWTNVANLASTGGTGYYLVVVSTIQYNNFYAAFDTIEDSVDFLTNGIFQTYIVAQPVGQTPVTLKVTGLATDTTYFASVWGMRHSTSGTVPTDIFGQEATLEGDTLSTFGIGVTFATPPQLPSGLAPAAAANNVTVKPTFQWNTVPNASSYLLQVSTDNFTTFVAPTSATDVKVTGTAYAWPSTAAPLAYNTTYYWRVRATTTSGNSDWTTNTFTTMAAPISPLPAVTVNIQTQAPITLLPPAITVNVPAQPTPVFTLPAIVFPAQPTPVINLPAPVVNIPQAETPIYIWIIVAVGAVLTIAVIVLIIRTRRVV